MADATLAPLPRGRHSLSRQQVADSQRLRLAIALADAMAVHGYVGTPVAAIIEGAGVSRETFYRLYDSKLACFLDALDFVGAVLLAELGGALEGADPVERASAAVGRYLDTIVDHPAFARLFLVEVHAAGPEAMRRRAALQDQVVQALAHLLDARSASQRFACRAYVAAVSSMVTLPIVEADEAAIQALRRPLLAQLPTLVEPP